MTQTVRVVSTDGEDFCTVEYSRKSACGGNCVSCRGCKTENIIRTKAYNALGADEGDLVLVESSKKEIFGIAALVYMVPALLLIIGYLAGESLFREAYAPGLCAAAGFFAGIALAVLYARGKKNKVLLKVIKVIQTQSQPS